MTMKKAAETNLAKLEEKFELITPYKNILDTITARCKICGGEETKTARTFLRSGCSNCRKLEQENVVVKRFKKEDEAYLKRINTEDNEYEIVKYREAPEDVLEVRHIPCGKVEKIENRHIGYICYDCHPEKLINADWYRKLYPKLVKEGYEVVRVIYGPYTKSKSRSTSLEILHKECGNNFTRINHTLKQPGGYLCPICNKGPKRLGEITEENIDMIVKNELGEDYEYHSEFKDSVSNFKIKHLYCGTVYEKRLSSIRNGAGRCPTCRRILKIKKAYLKQKEQK